MSLLWKGRAVFDHYLVPCVRWPPAACALWLWRWPLEAAAERAAHLCRRQERNQYLNEVIVNPEHVRNEDISKEVLAEKHQVRCKRFVDAHITKAFKGPKLEKVRFPICPFVDYRARLLVDSVNVSNRQHCQQRPYSETVPRKRVVRTSVELWCQDYTATPPPQLSHGCKSTGRADVGRAGSGLRELTNQIGLGVLGGGS